VVTPQAAHADAVKPRRGVALALVLDLAQAQLVLGNRSRSGSRSRSGALLACLRVQSLIQSIGAASRSLVDIIMSAVRSRTNLIMWLSKGEGKGEEQWLSNRSDVMPSSPEGHTFGVNPVRVWERGEAVSNVSKGKEEALGLGGHAKEEMAATVTPGSVLARTCKRQQSMLSTTAPSERPSERTIHLSLPTAIPEDVQPPMPSNVLAANQLFVMALATVEGSLDSTEVPSSWGGASNRFFEGGSAHAKTHHLLGGHWHSPA
jgi:hypothetical protein